MPVRSGTFKRDVKRAEKRGKDMKRLRALLLLLIEGTLLPEHYRDHPLKGEWAGWRDAHIEPDWLLIYRIAGNELHLARTGTHSDLFDE
ncbi:type II toxin-antitoxin system YafQ family toxin [Nitrosomonas sp. HPC101]|uniref:type II toxin-antitoxin system YafQ family toxin n=1 Tax=Nitrosomonas sp. HPC101 TaxID=1658667 RepID=UPI0013DE2602|nr:type II toxin-antitoxin system YafQ family toxin [Nitrosomonas sp. HPC101]